MAEPVIVDYRDPDSTRRARVFVDGLERRRVVRCQLGSGGWAEVIVFNGNDEPVLDRRRRLKKQRVTGVVTLRVESSRDAFLLERLRSRSSSRK